MGAMCCVNTTNNIENFWKNVNLINQTFDSYQKIYYENKRKWLSSGGSVETVDLKNCNELYDLLDISELSQNQRIFYFDKLNEYINNLPNKLTFFTSLAFFTKTTPKYEVYKSTFESTNVLETFKNEQSYVVYNLNGEANQIILHEKIFSILIKMAKKKSDHDDVTKCFIDFVTEFPLQFIYEEIKDFQEKKKIYSIENRHKLFLNLKLLNNQEFYKYMFSRDNVCQIHNDLLKINSKDLDEITMTNNENDTHK
jgi:hypothetical protein